ncbi:MAG TPA: polysaccharide biosynthesis/export family protein [Pyrinomonadaceae bacterium]|nr:polysaccharide biosynthesis/export family protein [Pyrinomonadaceae bacterium]
MKAKTYLFLFVALCLASPQRLSAQEQGGSGIVPVSSVDEQGIMKYQLGPGDTLDIRVFGQPDLNWTGEVDSDGNISSLPFVETPIRAQCRTDKEVQKDIIAAYGKLLKNPQISVRVTGRNSRQPAVVLGAVLAPTRAEMKRKVRLNEIIAIAGGTTERANGDIAIMHTMPVMCPEPGEVVEPLVSENGLNALKIYKVRDLLDGRPEANPYIRPGDIINVMDAKPIHIVGYVGNPQPMLLREGMTLLDAIMQAGGARKGAKDDDIRIYRTKPGAEGRELIRVNYAAIKKRKQPDVALQAYDIVEVPEASIWRPDRLLEIVAGAATRNIGILAGSPGQVLTRRVIY